MKFLHSISPPPPIGGVTKSVKNLSDSLLSLGYESHFINQFKFFNSYDVGHVHSSNSLKRLYFILLMRIFCKKVVFTVHGLYFKPTFINKISVILSDGTIFLNSKLFNEWSFLSKSKWNSKFIILSSVFKEGATDNFSLSSKSFFDNDKSTILLYAQNRSFKNGEEVYGIEFALNTLLMSPDLYNVILIDIGCDYKYLYDRYNSVLCIKYFDKEVDFIEMLSKSDIYLRPTSMDGSSLAVQEALLQRKVVIASNVVDRPSEVNLYKHLDSNSLLDCLSNSKLIHPSQFTLKSVVNYIDFVKSL